MKENVKKWIWQHENYPLFPYDKNVLHELLAKIEYNRGQLDGLAKLFHENEKREIEMEALIEEIINTSEIIMLPIFHTTKQAFLISPHYDTFGNFLSPLELELLIA